jgi:hypothetical protein
MRHEWRDDQIGQVVSSIGERKLWPRTIAARKRIPPNVSFILSTNESEFSLTLVFLAVWRHR